MNEPFMPHELLVTFGRVVTVGELAHEGRLDEALVLLAVALADEPELTLGALIGVIEAAIDSYACVEGITFAMACQAMRQEAATR